ncbi:hypothetical protein MPSEU_000149100 [Mayamaea pseudoterrestris]|nr:hypothetical protein MPSEU_000149100 [Mayamaea pseudoterrestris]
MAPLEDEESYNALQLHDPAADAENLVKPLLEAISSYEQVNRLRELKLVIAETCQDFVREALAAYVIQKVVLLEPSETPVYLETLLACGSLSVLTASIRLLKDATNLQANTLKTIIMTLKHILFNICWWKEIECSSTFEEEAAIDAWVQCVLLIPQLIANACRAVHHSLPSWSVPSRYFVRLVHATTLAWEINDCNTALFMKNLLQRLLRRNHGDLIAQGLWDFHEAATTLSSVNLHDSTMYTYLSQHLIAKEAAILCQSILQLVVTKRKVSDASKVWMIQSACVHLLANQAAQEALVRTAVLHQKSVMADERMDQSFMELTVDLLVMTGARVSEMRENCNDDSSCSSDEDEDKNGVNSKANTFYTSHLDTVASAWAHANFVRQMDVSMQKHVTHFILHGLRQDESSAGTIMPESDLVNSLMMGVSERLSSSVSVVRLGGMRVGEALARRFNQELQFEELRDAEKIGMAAVVPQVQKNEVVEATAPSEDTQDSTVKDADLKRLQPLDDDSDWESDDELQPFDLNDDEEDLRDIPRPLYLNDCLDLLRAPETDEHAASKLMTVLQELPALVRSRPADLADVGLHLALQLINTENKFKFKKFGDQVLDSLAALTVQEPLSVGMPLIETIFEDLSLRCRTDILNTLNHSAFELSGAKEIQAVKQLRLEQFQRIQATTKVSGKRQLVANASDASGETSRTRRWGRGQDRPVLATVTNTFASVAPAWFYALVGNFMQRKGDTRLWAGDTGSKLLAHLFVSLSVIVECSGNNPGTAVLAKDLFQLVWTFRDADVPEVRASVLCGVATSLACLGEEAALGLLTSGSADGLPQYLVETSRSDPDDGCRDLAYQISQTVAKAIRCISL